MSAAASAPAFEILPERPADAEAVEGVVAAAFGPGRFAKASYRVRDLAVFRPELSFTAWRGGALVGTVRQWSVAVGGQPVAFLGPIAVDAEVRSGGLGAALVDAALAAAQAAGETAVLLVGDLPYFAPFGFVHAQGVTLPGPVDRARVLVRVLAGDPPVGRVSALPATRPAATGR